MQIFLAKFLPRLFYPLGLSCLCLLLALIQNFTLSWSTALTLAAFLMLWISGNHWYMLWLVRSLEWRHLPPDPIPQVELAVILGGGTRSAMPPRRQVEMNEAGDRVLMAANLYKEGKARHLLLTGGDIEWLDTGAGEADNMATMLARFDIPDTAIWRESRASTTLENAKYVQEILAEKGIQQVLLVTSAVHMPRALLIFERLGIEVIPMPADYIVTYARWEQLKQAGLRAQLLYLLPTAEDIIQTSRAAKEYVGLWLLKLQGLWAKAH